MDKIVLDMRERFFGELLPRALQSVQFALDEEKDGRLGYQLMKDSRVIPREKQRLDQYDAPVVQYQEHKRGVKRIIRGLWWMH
jgi:hypothetical protein